MDIRTKCSLIFFISAVVILLSACQQKTPSENIYTVLENAASLEKGYADQQAPLINLEKKEKTVYDKMVSLSMNQYNKIVQLSDNAISMADQRKTDIEKETESIKKSEKEFKEMASYKDEIKNKNLKKKANELYALMMNRYKAHDELYKAYINGISNDKELYEMFKDKGVSAESLENQVQKTNAVYKEIYTANNQFNILTRQYNEKKLEFYNMAGLKSK